jgi:MoaA/NifB/PqqE/SkfB family radical SAM enzyme
MTKEEIYLIRLPLLCNFNCLFCFLEKKESHLANFFWGDILRQIDEAKIRSSKVTFSGGEPTLIRELPILINYAKEKGIEEVEIQTNALKCAYKNYVKELKNAGLDSVLIGFHSHREKKFNLLTQTRGYFPKVLEGIHNLLKYKISVSFNHTITALTYRDLENYVRFIVKNFPKPRNIFLTLVYPCGQCWRHKELIPSASQVAPYFLRAWQYCRQKKIKVVTPHCGMPGFPLCLLDQRRENNLEGLISSDRKNIRTKEFDCVNLKSNNCQNCKYNKICVGIAQNYKKLYGLKEFKPAR